MAISPIPACMATMALGWPFTPHEYSPHNRLAGVIRVPTLPGHPPWRDIYIISGTIDLPATGESGRHGGNVVVLSYGL
jgi:hypothetical protein